MPFQPSPAQQAFYDWVTGGSGHAILEAVAGAGKTTTILNGISKMPGRVWLGVYNKKMANEIKDKVQERDAGGKPKFPELISRGRELDTSTFHSLGMKVWLWNHKGHQIDVDDKKMDRIVDTLIQEREGADQERRSDLREIAGMVKAIVSMAKNRGMGFLIDERDPSVWFEMIYQFDLDGKLPDGCSMDTVVKFAQCALKRSRKRATSVIDFDDMIYMPLDPKCRAWGYDWVLVDEAQDTNPARRALAEKILKPSGRLVAVGDPHQAIFGFTGADNDSLQQIKTRLKATSLPLTVTYRCPKAIVAHAKNWVSHIEAHETAPEGAVLTLPYMDLIDNLQANDPNVDPSETAILCRYNKYLVGLCFKLIREGIAAKIEGRSIGEGLVKLATRWKSVKTINGLETKLKEYRDREVKKALDKDNQDKADRIDDEVGTLFVLIERARERKIDRVSDLESMILEMFADGVSESGMLTLCSCHKSKGLEWDTVYLLDREAFMPSDMARLDWQIAQENNLIYVAVTRAKQTLVEVTDVKEEKQDYVGRDD